MIFKKLLLIFIGLLPIILPLDAHSENTITPWFDDMSNINMHLELFQNNEKRPLLGELIGRIEVVERDSAQYPSCPMSDEELIMSVEELLNCIDTQINPVALLIQFKNANNKNQIIDKIVAEKKYGNSIGEFEDWIAIFQLILADYFYVLKTRNLDEVGDKTEEMIFVLEALNKELRIAEREK